MTDTPSDVDATTAVLEVIEEPTHRDRDLIVLTGVLAVASLAAVVALAIAGVVEATAAIGVVTGVVALGGVALGRLTGKTS